jgi:hypothetical protein
VDIAEEDIPIDGDVDTFEGGVVRIDNDRVGGVTDADVLELHVFDQSAAAFVGLDAETVVRAIDREIRNGDVTEPAGGLAAQADTVSVVEVGICDGHVSDGANADSGFGGNIVIACPNEGVSDRNV